MVLNTHIKTFFWDIDPKKALPKKHPRYYATRILEMGDRQAVNWLFRLFGKKKIEELLPTLKLSARSANYWRHYFINQGEK